MKNQTLLIVLLVVLLGSILATGFAQKKIPSKKVDKDACLALVGYFNNTSPIKNVTVHLFMSSDLIDSVKLNGKKDFGFVLKRNKRYTIHIIAPGYYSRLLTLNTDLSDNINSTPLFVFEFDMMLIKEMKGVDDFYLDFPIASIAYDPKIKKFSFSHRYTETMEKEVKKAESDFKVRKSSH
jgi:hypothetical protein